MVQRSRTNNDQQERKRELCYTYKKRILRSLESRRILEGCQEVYSKKKIRIGNPRLVADIDLMMAKEKFNPFAITRKGGTAL